MSDPATTAPVSTPSPAWPALSLVERRVLGVLVEKAKTTPDIYPLSLNALATGCNQKSNRDPLLSVSDEEAEEVLSGLQKKGLVIKITGGRVIRWRHALYEAWQANKVELAVLAEFLLRGPQTEGELRSRASRMEPIDDLDALREVLRTLVDRGLVVYLMPPGRRGTMLTHGFHTSEDLERLKSKHGEASEELVYAAASAVRPPPAPALDAALQELRNELSTLAGTVANLQARVVELSQQLQQLKDGLGG